MEKGPKSGNEQKLKFPIPVEFYIGRGLNRMMDSLTANEIGQRTDSKKNGASPRSPAIARTSNRKQINFRRAWAGPHFSSHRLGRSLRKPRSYPDDAGFFPCARPARLTGAKGRFAQTLRAKDQQQEIAENAS